MSFNAAMLKAMRDEGLSLDACIRVVEAAERKADPTNAQRQARHRAKRNAEKDDSNAVTVTGVTPPNDRDILTPREVSEPSGSSPQPRAWALPVGVSLQVWEDLMTNRRKKRLPNTSTAWAKFQSDLAEMSAQTGIPPPKLIEQCTARGWGAIYDPRDQRNERSSNPTGDAVSNVLRRIGADDRTRQDAGTGRP